MALFEVTLEHHDGAYVILFTIGGEENKLSMECRYTVTFGDTTVELPDLPVSEK